MSLKPIGNGTSLGRNNPSSLMKTKKPNRIPSPNHSNPSITHPDHPFHAAQTVISTTADDSSTERDPSLPPPHKKLRRRRPSDSDSSDPDSLSDLIIATADFDDADIPTPSEGGETSDSSHIKASQQPASVKCEQDERELQAWWDAVPDQQEIDAQELEDEQDEDGMAQNSEGEEEDDAANERVKEGKIKRVEVESLEESKEGGGKLRQESLIVSQSLPLEDETQKMSQETRVMWVNDAVVAARGGEAGAEDDEEADVSFGTNGGRTTGDTSPSLILAKSVANPHLVHGHDDRDGLMARADRGCTTAVAEDTVATLVGADTVMVVVQQSSLLKENQKDGSDLERGGVNGGAENGAAMQGRMDGEGEDASPKKEEKPEANHSHPLTGNDDQERAGDEDDEVEDDDDEEEEGEIELGETAGFIEVSPCLSIARTSQEQADGLSICRADFL